MGKHRKDIDRGVWIIGIITQDFTNQLRQLECKRRGRPSARAAAMRAQTVAARLTEQLSECEQPRQAPVSALARAAGLMRMRGGRQDLTARP